MRINYILKFEYTNVLLFIFGLLIRIYAIDRSNVIVWDESHFSLTTSEYVGNKFHFDLHPPLGKQILTIVGKIVKFDTSLYSRNFPFPGGAKYPNGLNYIVLRITCALFGSFMVPLAYKTALELKISRRTAIILGILIAIENSLVEISKFILLDSFLLFFNSLTCYCFLKFNNLKSREFSIEWWKWLLLLGTSMGCLISVKWSGLFTYSLIGLFTLYDLFIYYIKHFKMKKYIIHWISRILFLIILPASIYLTTFYVNFKYLKYSGSGNPKMSSEFKMNLLNSKSDDSLDVEFNSIVTIKNSRIGGGTLFSTPTLRNGNKWVTTYLLNDINNEWIIKNTNESNSEYLKDGDVIRLLHKQSEYYMEMASYQNTPFTKSMKIVYCKKIPTSNSLWKVEVIKNKNIYDYITIEKGEYKETKDSIHPILTQFRLRNLNNKCLLRSHNVVLPMKMGWKRLEAGCEYENYENSTETLWHIEKHYVKNKNPNYKYKWKLPQSFIRNFLDYHSAMINVNKMMEPFPRTFMRLDSHPKQWPFLKVGVRMLNWDDETVKFYLLGNPLIWWLSTISLGILFLLLITKIRKNISIKNKNAIFSGCFVIGGWLLNYIPYFIIGRMKYLHHYFTALYSQ